MLQQIMRSERRISLGVYRDYVTPEADIEPVLEGLHRVARIATQLDIVDTGKFVDIGREQTIPIERTAWVQTPYDFSIVATQRQIGEPAEDNLRTLGVTLGRRWFNDYTVLGSYGDGDLTSRVTRHETGHLFEVKRTGDHFDGMFHCEHPECIMQRVERPHLTDFCDECTQQLAAGSLKKATRRQYPRVSAFMRSLYSTGAFS